MSSRLVVPLVCTAAIVFACGPRNHSASSASAASEPAGRAPRVASLDGSRRAAPKRPKRTKGDTAAVDASLAVIPVDDGVRLDLQLVNRSTHRVEIDFPDGRTRDFAIYDASGREVWRWSRGRLFTQTVQNKFLGAGDTTFYHGRWEGAAPGMYTAVAILRSQNYPAERRVSFRVGGESVATR
jgi:hypothetical protein